MTQKYHIKSKNTGFYLLSENEADQDVVSTRDGRTSVPEHSVRIQLSYFIEVVPHSFYFDQILTFNPAVQGSVVVATITGVKNLYVALPKVSLHLTRVIFPIHSNYAGDLVSQISVLGRSRGYQAHLVQGKIWVDNQIDSEDRQLRRSLRVSHSLNQINPYMWLIAVLLESLLLTAKICIGLTSLGLETL